jgi:superfamily II DNA/RNA helicase
MPQEMKQVCVFSATYPTELEDVLKNFMRSPTLLRLNVDGDQQLIGVKEYCVFCDTVKKADALVILLNKIIFNQCIIFCDSLDL